MKSTSLFISLLLLLLPLSACERGAAATPPAPPSPVTYMTVTQRRVTLAKEWVATLDGFINAQIRPQVTGYLVARTHREGGSVAKGQTLFKIDPRPFESAVALANARLAEAEALLRRTERDLQRDRPLAEQRAIAQSQLDNDMEANFAAQAAVKSAGAAVEAAELNLSFTNVTSLAGGIAAIATAQIGDLVGPTTLLTTVSQIDPIKAYFSLSEQEYLALAERINSGRDAGPWGPGGLTLILADGERYDEPGTFLAADREIDQKTGTIRLSATFANPKGILRPGQYGRIRADSRVIERAMLVPQRSVTEMQGIRQVRVLVDGNRVAIRSITTGDRVGSDWIIETGVAPGDRVIVEGVGAVDVAIVVHSPATSPAETR